MEAQPATATPAPEAERKPDIRIETIAQRIIAFHPMTLKAQAWLARNVPQEYHANGHVVTGPLKAAQLALWAALDGLVLK